MWLVRVITRSSLLSKWSMVRLLTLAHRENLVGKRQPCHPGPPMEFSHCLRRRILCTNDMTTQELVSWGTSMWLVWVVTGPNLLNKWSEIRLWFLVYGKNLIERGQPLNVGQVHQDSFTIYDGRYFVPITWLIKKLVSFGWIG